MKAKQTMIVQVQNLDELKTEKAIAVKILEGKLLTEKEFEIAVRENYFNDIPYSLYTLLMYSDDEMNAQINPDHAQFVKIVDSFKRYFRQESASWKENFFGIFPVETKREFLTAEQIELFKQYGFTDEEIGRGMSIYDYVRRIVLCL